MAITIADEVIVARRGLLLKIGGARGLDPLAIAKLPIGRHGMRDGWPFTLDPVTDQLAAVAIENPLALGITLEDLA